MLAAACSVDRVRISGTASHTSLSCTAASTTTVLLCGDVMLGRGIDQILKRPGDATLHEGYMRSAVDYVDIAERVNGPIPRNVSNAYVWGDVPLMLRTATPRIDAIVINLETAVTTSDDLWRGKAVHYRMHPANAAPVLSAIGVNCCALANNHVLDWGLGGLDETVRTLRAAGIATAGAGLTRATAAAPAVVELGAQRRLLVFSLGSTTAGVPPEWGASGSKPGVLMLDGPFRVSLAELHALVHAHKRPGDLAIASVHWGSNWGYEIPPERRRVAHALVDQAGFDLVHGHSSHHPIGVEVRNRKLIVFSCGDFINDYEGIEHHAVFRGDLALAFLPSLDSATGELRSLEMWPLQIRRFQLVRAAPVDAAWLAAIMDRECAKFGGGVELRGGSLWLIF